MFHCSSLIVDKKSSYNRVTYSATQGLLPPNKLSTYVQSYLEIHTARDLKLKLASVL